MIPKLIKHLGVLKEHLGVFAVAIFCIAIFIGLLGFIFGIMWTWKLFFITIAAIIFIFWISTTRY